MICRRNLSCLIAESCRLVDWRRRRRRPGLLGAASCVSSDDFWQSRIIGSARDIHLVVCPGRPLRLFHLLMCLRIALDMKRMPISLIYLVSNLCSSLHVSPDPNLYRPD